MDSEPEDSDSEDSEDELDLVGLRDKRKLDEAEDNMSLFSQENTWQPRNCSNDQGSDMCDVGIPTVVSRGCSAKRRAGPSNERTSGVAHSWPLYTTRDGGGPAAGELPADHGGD